MKKRAKKSEGIKGDNLRDIAPNKITGRGWTYIFPKKILIGFARGWDIWLNDPQDSVSLSEKYPDLSFDLTGCVLTVKEKSNASI